MPDLIIEGPDGSGKSTMAEFLSSAIGLSYRPSSEGPPPNLFKLINRIEQQIKAEEQILDRCSIVSELVYGQALRNKSLIEKGWLYHLPCPILYCRPSLETLLSFKLRTKPHKELAHVKQVTKNLRTIVELYDEIMEDIKELDIVPVLTYNRDTTEMEEIIPCVESILLTEKKP